MEKSQEKPTDKTADIAELARGQLYKTPATAEKPQEYYEAIKRKFSEERDLRVKYKPSGTGEYIYELEGNLARYEVDTYAPPPKARDPLVDTVEVLFIGGGFSALLASAKLREHGVDSIRIVERGADVGGTWYWNRYPGIACDVVSYDYLPLLDEMNYVPRDHYAKGDEIFAHCRAIAEKYDLYGLAVFQTTVISTVWSDTEQLWTIKTDRGDVMKTRFVVCANGPMSKPKLAKIDGIEDFKGHSFHSSRWDYAYTNQDLSGLEDKVVGIIGTGATAVQAVPKLGAAVKELYVFQRTPSSIDFRSDWPTDPNWARKLKPGWQAQRRERTLMATNETEDQKVKRAAISQEEKVRKQENANIDAMMRIHRRIEHEVKDPATAEALKPWYMLMCKRPCFHEDYLATFNRPNVHLIDTHGKGIHRITEKGPEFEGKVYEVDVLIYATGFDVQKTGIYNQIVGENGLEINDKYKDGIRTMFGVHSHGYPNMFIMAGYQASFQFNLTDMLYAQGEHIAACVDYTREHGYATLEVTPEAEEWWVQEVIKFRGKTDRNKDCTPGYYNFEGEFNRRQDGTYNGGFYQYVAHTKEVQAQMEKYFAFKNRNN
ncbi:MAG: NAD(P)/FAD-dependent oxidoreductase [Alphaproteobacteria bacterium]|nr:NAD(P)/FAD-dependent oxidoreductase [Alphaproteobacteria bacterium]